MANALAVHVAGDRSCIGSETSFSLAPFYPTNSPRTQSDSNLKIAKQPNPELL